MTFNNNELRPGLVVHGLEVPCLEDHGLEVNDHMLLPYIEVVVESYILLLHLGDSSIRLPRKAAEVRIHHREVEDCLSHRSCSSEILERLHLNTLGKRRRARELLTTVLRN
jgi:hypothetical protein